MKENTNKDFSSIRDKFKMDPPDHAWDMLNSELERKQATQYKQRANRFKLLSIGLALLLVASVAYYYISPGYYTLSVKAPGIVAAHSFTKKSNSINKKPLANHNAAVETASASATIVPEGGLGTWDLGNSSHLSRSSSLHNNGTEEVANAPKAAVDERSKSSSAGERQAASSNRGAASAGNANDDFKTRPGDPSATSDNDNKVKETNTPMKNPDTLAESQKEDNNKAVAASSTLSDSKSSGGGLNDSILNKAGSSHSRWSIAAFYSPDYYAKNYLKTDNAAYSENIADYNDREKTAYSFATGLALRYDITSKWSISVGGSYSTIAYSIAIPTVYAKYGSDDQLHYQYPTSCGNIEIPNTSNSTLYYGDSLHINGACTQLVKLVSVPVTVRYNIGGNRIRFYIDGGFSANFVVQEKASMNIWNTEMTIINNDDGIKKMNYGYLLGAGAECTLYGQLNAFVEPSFRGSITSLTDNTSYYCYPFAFNLNMGLSVHF